MINFSFLSTNQYLFRDFWNTAKGDCHFVRGMNIVKKKLSCSIERDHKITQLFNNDVLLKELIVLNYVLYILITYDTYLVSLTDQHL